MVPGIGQWFNQTMNTGRYRTFLCLLVLYLFASAYPQQSRATTPADVEPAAYLYAIHRWNTGGQVYLSFDVKEAVLRKVQAVAPQIRRYPLDSEARLPNFLSLSVMPAWNNLVVNRRDLFLRVQCSRTSNAVDHAPFADMVIKATKKRGRWSFQEMPSSPLPPEAQIAAYTFLARNQQNTPLIVDASNTIIQRLQSRQIPTKSAQEYQKNAAKFDVSGYYYTDIGLTSWMSKETIYVSVYTRRHPPKNDVSYESYGTLRLTRRSGRWNVTDTGHWQGE